MPKNRSIQKSSYSFKGKTIALTGSGGFIGSYLQKFFNNQGAQIIQIDRSLLYDNNTDLQQQISNCDVIINLAGASIKQRWTEKNKKVIYESRIITTQNLAKAIQGLETKERPKHFLSVSAVGLYENEKPHSETSTDYDNGFLGQVVKDWEKAMEDIANHIPCTIFRLGIVLSHDAPIIKSLSPLFKLGIGAQLGNGLQAFPFIHIQDVINAFAWAIEEKKTGIFNLCTPQQINNRDFTKAFAKTFRRPAFFTIPTFVIRLAFGKMSIILLKSPIVESKKLLKSGFHFSIKTIQEALEHSIS